MNRIYNSNVRFVRTWRIGCGALRSGWWSDRRSSRVELSFREHSHSIEAGGVAHSMVL